MKYFVRISFSGPFRKSMYQDSVSCHIFLRPRSYFFCHGRKVYCAWLSHIYESLSFCESTEIVSDLERFEL